MQVNCLSGARANGVVALSALQSLDNPSPNRCKFPIESFFHGFINKVVAPRAPRCPHTHTRPPSSKRSRLTTFASHLSPATLHLHSLQLQLHVQRTNEHSFFHLLRTLRISSQPRRHIAFLLIYTPQAEIAKTVTPPYTLQKEACAHRSLRQRLPSATLCLCSDWHTATPASTPAQDHRRSSARPYTACVTCLSDRPSRIKCLSLLERHECERDIRVHDTARARRAPDVVILYDRHRRLSQSRKRRRIDT
jgi:hypothetical protein